MCTPHYKYKKILLNDDNYNELEALTFVMDNNEFCIEHMNNIHVWSNGYTALCIACKNNAIEVVKFLINNGADVNTNTKYRLTPLCIALCKGNTTIVKLLISNGADVNKSINNGHTILHYAVCTKNAILVKLLIDNGAVINNVNNYGRTPLYIALRYSYTHIVKLLLDAMLYE